MAPFDLYGMQLSAPVRIVQMTAEVLGVEFKFHTVDLMSGEHLKPEFLSINPMHNVPTMVDEDFTLNESRAIATYLVTQYGKDSTLVPGDVKSRAVVDQRMYFDMGTFYKAFGDVIYPIMFGGPAPGDKEKNRLAEVLGWVNDWVKDGKFVAGTDTITLGDISCLATFSSIVACGLFDAAKFPHLMGWFDKCKAAIPNYEKMNGEGATVLGDFYKSKATA